MAVRCVATDIPSNQCGVMVTRTAAILGAGPLFGNAVTDKKQPVSA